MRAPFALTLAPLLALVAAAPAWSDEKPAWRSSLDEGLAAARESGKPVLVVTLWKAGV